MQEEARTGLPGNQVSALSNYVIDGGNTFHPVMNRPATPAVRGLDPTASLPQTPAASLDLGSDGDTQPLTPENAEALKKMVDQRQ